MYPSDDNTSHDEFLRDNHLRWCQVVKAQARDFLFVWLVITAAIDWQIRSFRARKKKRQN
jgi:hypothetical protein